MCGIFSILNSRYDDKRIQDCFKHGKKRGPEKSTLIDFNNKKLIFGFHRLAINGFMDPKADQPFHINDIVLICNGEIYNWKELYSMMGVEGKSNSDCEVIIYLYLKYGIEHTLKMLDGVFAFLLYDIKENKVFVARDAFGIRPLFVKNMQHSTKKFANISATYSFASELKQLINLDNHRNIKQFTPGTYSLYNITENNVFKIIENKPFYVIHSIPSQFKTNITEQYIKDACLSIKNSLTKAVEKRVHNTEREIACLLSGGLDSSLIAALVCKLSPSKKITTWSIGMKGSEDLKYAKMVAEHIKSEHNEIIISEVDMLRSIESVIYDIESYDTTTVRASIGNWMVSNFIKNDSDCKVVFNGDGSDEVCGGYLYFHHAPDSLEFDKECRRLLKQIHFFDVLRSDRSISSHGLEARTPFLDKHFVDTYLSINPNLRNHVKMEKCEKYLLRKAFDEDDLLPKQVLWRTKEAFSDGVSGDKKSWFEILQNYIANNIFNHSPNILAKQRYYYNTNRPTTLEQLHYRMVFESNFIDCGHIIPKFWMPNFIEATDASARTLDVYKKQMEKENIETSYKEVNIVLE